MMSNMFGRSWLDRILLRIPVLGGVIETAITLRVVQTLGLTTQAALPMTKRDLSKLGITTPEQMERPIPKGIVCKVSVTLRADDDGTQRNHVRKFDVLRVEIPQADPFAPTGDAAEPTGAADTSFIPEGF